MLLLPQCCAWPRSCPSVPARGVDHRRSATMSNATLFCGTLEPTRMRWKSAQVHTTSLETREANVQQCNGVKSVCNSTERNKDMERDRQKTNAKEREREKERKTEREKERERERKKERPTVVPGFRWLCSLMHTPGSRSAFHAGLPWAPTTQIGLFCAGPW